MKVHGADYSVQRGGVPWQACCVATHLGALEDVQCRYEGVVDVGLRGRLLTGGSVIDLYSQLLGRWGASHATVFVISSAWRPHLC